MRILFLTHRLPYAPNRGDRVRAFHLLRLLSSAHDVHLVSLLHGPEEEERVHEMSSLVSSVRGAKVPRLRNRLAAGAALLGRQPLTHLLLASPRFGSSVRECVAAARPELVFAYGTGVARAAFLAPLADTPCVLDMVDVDSQKWADLAGSHSGAMKLIYAREARTLRRFEREALRRAAVTTVVSERERRLAARVLGDPAPLAILNGVDLAAWSAPAGVSKRPDVVFSGVFNYEPNEEGALWLAAQVWPLVRRAEPNAVLRVVGMNPSRRIRALAQPGSIDVTGAVPDVRPYLWQAAAAVAPLWLARGTQNKVMEALAAGTPCIVTPPVLEGLPEAVRHACLCRSTPSAFAEAVVSLLRSSRCGQLETRKAVAELDWSVQLRPFLEVLETARARRV